MAVLTLKFTDADGQEKNVPVDGPYFSVGRHSKNQLTITDGRLSREHLAIELANGEFLVNDLGSSNGTTLNGERLEKPTALKDNDKISLGGFEIECSLSSDPDDESDSNRDDASLSVDTGEPAAGNSSDPPGPSKRSVPVHAEAGPGLPTSIFFVAPIAALGVLGLVVTLIYLSGGNTNQRDNSNFVYSHNTDDEPSGRTPAVDPDDTPTTGGSNGTRSNSTISDPTPSGTVTETTRIETNAGMFLRAAAQNDPKAFITGEQAKIVEARIKSLSDSPAVADNINSARRSAADIKALAVSKNLRPQLLAAAALAKLGTSRGDVVSTARSMSDTLDKLSTQIGSELGDDCLLMIAAYDQGAAGDYLRMRNMLQDLATKMPDSSRAIRTIWFLKKNNKITDSEFDLALRFLAVGTIAQNPRDFGVNTDRLAF